MTEASTGLRKALARNAGVSKLTTEELIAQMTDEQKTALAASLAPPAAAASDAPAAEAEDDGDEDDLEMGDKKKAKKDGDEYMADDKAKAERDRCLAVMASEHFAGNQQAAAKLLANDKLSADEIIGLLADLGPAGSADTEAAARAEMQAALKENAPSGVEANDSAPKTNPASKASDVWGSAIAKVFPDNKFA